MIVSKESIDNILREFSLDMAVAEPLIRIKVQEMAQAIVLLRSLVNGMTRT